VTFPRPESSIWELLLLIQIQILYFLGQFGLYAAACGCQVYMFEVDPMKISLLQMSIKLNSFESRITLIPKAVTDLLSNTKVYISLNTSSQISSNEIKNHSNIYSVETISLNQLNLSSDIYLLRVDVEGYEIHVIRGCEKLFRENRIHHVLFQYTPKGTDGVIQNDLLPYMRDILGGKRFYALHPKEAIIYGPLYNDDIDQFYTQHQAQNLERDVYVLFQDEDIYIDSKPYEFPKSFD
jgi:FkbM family methyltransferase